MIEQPILAVVALACMVATVVWGRSAHRLERVWRRVQDESGPESDAAVLARSAYRKDLHTGTLYFVLALAGAVSSMSTRPEIDLVFIVVVIPVVVSVLFGRDFIREARIAESRSYLERRAE